MVLKVLGNRLLLGAGSYPCAVGRGGFSADKREGDGCTPLGVFALRACWYRADRTPAPQTGLALRMIQPDDGWCDDPGHALYNRPVKLPFTASHERLWRDDHVYDLVVPLGYNDNPVIPGRGSAIFMHLARADHEPTEGCVALALADMLEALSHCGADARIDIRGNQA